MKAERLWRGMLERGGNVRLEGALERGGNVRLEGALEQGDRRWLTQGGRGVRLGKCWNGEVMLKGLFINR
jgi:hypothetical protein